MAIIEICKVEHNLADKITANASYAELKKMAIGNGMIPLRDYGWSKVGAGLTTIEEVLSNVDH
jgi:type II secretory ATPase GspE/PulE/Tfp pilus assembly ATPase PilB-like protein